jgi:MFS family permease
MAPAVAPAGVLLPLVLAQFLCSFAATSTSVAIKPIAADLGTDVGGVQAAITLFTLTMAVLMIPGSKLTAKWGRRFCLVLGLLVYGTGAVVASISTGILVLMLGYSLLQGVGTALLIPPVYIFATVLFSGKARAAAFGAISAAGGIGAAAGPLIGGLITSATSWRVTFLVQAGMVLLIIWLIRRIARGAKFENRGPEFDLGGAVLSGAGPFFLVVSILLTGTYGWGLTTDVPLTVGGTTLIAAGGPNPTWLGVTFGIVLLAMFFRHIARREAAGREPLLPIRMFRDRVADLGLVTQNAQWLILQGLSFVISVYFQTARGFNSVQTGLVLTPATLGILASSVAAGRLSQRRPQAVLIRAGFVLTLVGLGLVLVLGQGGADVIAFAPGLLVAGLGVGVMVTSSVNVVQSAFPESEQDNISGLSRSVSNLGSSLGVAIAGSVIVSSRFTGDQGYVGAVLVLAGAGLVGLLAAILLPSRPPAVEVGTTSAPSAAAV